jgi:hypothetical protein
LTKHDTVLCSLLDFKLAPTRMGLTHLSRLEDFELRQKLLQLHISHRVMRRLRAQRCIEYREPRKNSLACSFCRRIATHSACRVIFAIQADHLDHDQLQQLIEPRNLIINVQYPRDLAPHSKSITQMYCVCTQRRQKCLHKFGNKVFKLVVDGVYREDGGFADVRVTMLEARATRDSRSSASLDILLKKQRVALRIHSFGCC